ncbi:uncharacterized protein [Rhodnius prolixus]
MSKKREKRDGSNEMESAEKFSSLESLIKQMATDQAKQMNLLNQNFERVNYEVLSMKDTLTENNDMVRGNTDQIIKVTKVVEDLEQELAVERKKREKSFDMLYMNMKTSVEEQKHYIKNQTEELSNNILTKIQNHIAVIEDNRNEWTKECDGKLEDIEQRINRIEMRELPSVQGGGAMDLCNIKCRVRFVDTQKQNPIEFLKEFERKYKSLSDKIKIEIFEQHLDGRGMAWFQLVVDKIKTFDELKQKFINYFWDDVEQGKAVEVLQTGRFDVSDARKADEYAMIVYQMCKNVDKFPISETKMLQLIAKHFGNTFAQAVVVQGIQDFEIFLKVLNGFPLETIHRECRRSEFKPFNERTSNPRYQQNSNQQYSRHNPQWLPSDNAEGAKGSKNE